MSWFKNLDYHDTWDKLRTALTSNSAKNKYFKRLDRKIKIAILLIALRNGCRLTEAMNSYNTFVVTGKRVLPTRVMKRGFAYVKDANGVRRRASQSKTPENPVTRTIHIPEEVSQEWGLHNCTKQMVSNFCRRNFGFNVHALRYCFITAMSKDGIAPQVIAKMTQHATLTEIIRYTEQQAADEILERGVLD